MKVVGSFNKVSEKLKKELIPKVERGQIVHLQLLNGVFDAAMGRDCFGASRSIRLSDKILDPYHKETKDEKGQTVYESEYVDIGVPVPGGIKEGRVERCGKHWVEALANGIPGNGQFQFTGGNIEEMEIFEFLCLANGNAGNPHRDQSKDPIYKIIDTKAVIAEEKAKDKKELENKLKRFAKQYPEEAAEFAKILETKKAAPTP